MHKKHPAYLRYQIYSTAQISSYQNGQAPDTHVSTVITVFQAQRALPVVFYIRRWVKFRTVLSASVRALGLKERTPFILQSQGGKNSSGKTVSKRTGWESQRAAWSSQQPAGKARKSTHQPLHSPCSGGREAGAKVFLGSSQQPLNDFRSQRPPKFFSHMQN